MSEEPLTPLEETPVTNIDMNDVGALSTQRFWQDPAQIEAYRINPSRVLEEQRANLFTLGQDTLAPDDQRHERLNSAIDAYFDHIVAMDKAAFPDSPGKLNQGLPEYVADGMLDMGSSSALERGPTARPIIYVDKRSVLGKYKELFAEIFTTDTSDFSKEEKVRLYAEAIGKVTYGLYSDEATQGSTQQSGVELLSQIGWGSCRHIALSAQVALQALGIESILSKNHKVTVPLTDGNPDANSRPIAVSHASNFVKIGENYWLFDAANPIWKDDEHHSKEDYQWKGVMLPIDLGDDSTNSTFVLQTTYEQRTYALRGDMFWTIDRSRAARS